MSSGCIDPHFVDLGTSWRRVVSFAPRPLFSWGNTPWTHWIGGWVNPRAGLDELEKRKFLALLGVELQPLGRPARSQSLYRLCTKPSDLKGDNCRVPIFRRATILIFWISQLTPWNIVSFWEAKGRPIVKICFAFYVSPRLLPCSQYPAINPYPLLFGWEHKYNYGISYICIFLLYGNNP
jgi:hypothetical protein